jgi:hypothetical protein
MENLGAKENGIKAKGCLVAFATPSTNHYDLKQVHLFPIALDHREWQA